MTITKLVDVLLSHKRYRKAEKRRLIKQMRASKSIDRSAEQKVRFGRKSKIVGMFAANNRFKVDDPGSTLTLSIPKVFSLIEDPVNAVRILQSFAASAKAYRFRSIRIDQSNLETYDLAANSLLDLIATEVETERRYNKIRLRFTGAYPRSAGVKRFIKSIGIVKHLNILHEMATPNQSLGIRLFDRRYKHYFDQTDPRKADFKSKTVSSFADHINDCLRDHNRVLTPLALHNLCDYVGEILDNAQEHSMFKDWSLQGYLDNSLKTPICEIALFNFGRSISETLDDLPADSYTRKQIDAYLSLHGGMKLFSTSWRKRDLLTLIALQGNVSSKNLTSESTRGQGTVDLIEFFQKVHKECTGVGAEPAKMAIVSGGTYILFDGKYRMREVVAGKGKVIAFNQPNDLFQRPDSNYVRSLGALHFPGTIISIRFPLGSTSTNTLGEN